MVDTSGARVPKACRTCAKAKVRCEPQSDAICKRCHRLGKECGEQASGAHRRQKPVKPTVEVSNLEAKLDRMAALLAASNPSATQLCDFDQSPNSPAMMLTGSPSIQSQNDDENLLRFFTARMVHLFPFVIVSTDISAQQLRQERPFFFLCLSMVACQKASRQREMSTTIQKYVAEHIILRNERSLDLLQGLLVFLAWFIGHSPVPVQTEGAFGGINSRQAGQGPAQLDVFMQLALAQLTSLRLGHGLSSLNRSSKPISYVGRMDKLVDSRQLHTLEERRAYLGCYYLTVMLSSCVRDMQPLRFTKYTDECCRAIEQKLEFPTDVFLVHLVRTMHLADRIVHTICSDDCNYPKLHSAPLGLIIRDFESELRNIKTSFSCEPPYSSVLLSHYDTLEILLYQIALNEELSDARCGDLTITRLDILFRCLRATKSFFDDFYSISSHYFPFLPFSIWCQFGHAVVLLSRLSLFQSEDGWDLDYVQNTIDFDQTIDRMMHKLDEAQIFAEQSSGPMSLADLPEIFGRLSNRMQLMKESHRQKKESLEKAQPQCAQSPPNFDFLFNISFNTLFPFEEYNFLDQGVDMSQSF